MWKSTVQKHESVLNIRIVGLFMFKTLTMQDQWIPHASHHELESKWNCCTVKIYWLYIGYPLILDWQSQKCKRLLKWEWNFWSWCPNIHPLHCPLLHPSYNWKNWNKKMKCVTDIHLSSPQIYTFKQRHPKIWIFGIFIQNLVLDGPTMRFNFFRLFPQICTTPRLIRILLANC